MFLAILTYFRVAAGFKSRLCCLGQIYKTNSKQQEAIQPKDKSRVYSYYENQSYNRFKIQIHNYLKPDIFGSNHTSGSSFV